MGNSPTSEELKEASLDSYVHMEDQRELCIQLLLLVEKEIKQQRYEEAQKILLKLGKALNYYDFQDNFLDSLRMHSYFQVSKKVFNSQYKKVYTQKNLFISKVEQVDGPRVQGF